MGANGNKNGDGDGDDICICIQKSEPIFIQPQTKDHTGFYLLSNLDQIFHHFQEVELLYKVHEGEGFDKCYQDFVTVIKQALAKVLVHFYPLAGRLRVTDNGKFMVQCTNEGVAFVEAVADCSTDAVNTELPSSVTASRFIYTSPGTEKALEEPLMTVQVTRFRCGGFALGLAISHCLTDGTASFPFAKAWAETARGMTLQVKPFLNRSIIKPRQPPGIEYHFDKYCKVVPDVSEMCSVRRGNGPQFKSFLFDSEKLARLKQAAMEDGMVKDCTRFTVLAAFIWRARAKAPRMKPQEQGKLLLIIDARTKQNPPLPKTYFGNGIGITQSSCTAGELVDKPLPFSVKKVQNAIRAVDDNFVKSWIDCFEVNGTARPYLGDAFMICSLTRFHPEIADFGWGTPVQAGRVSSSDELCWFYPCAKDQMKVIIGIRAPAMEVFEELVQEIEIKPEDKVNGTDASFY